MGSVGGSVGRAVASDTRDPRFESQNWQILSTNCSFKRKGKNEEKEARNSHLFKNIRRLNGWGLKLARCLIEMENERKPKDPRLDFQPTAPGQGFVEHLVPGRMLAPFYVDSSAGFFCIASEYRTYKPKLEP